MLRNSDSCCHLLTLKPFCLKDRTSGGGFIMFPHNMYYLKEWSMCEHSALFQSVSKVVWPCSGRMSPVQGHPACMWVVSFFSSGKPAELQRKESTDRHPFQHGDKVKCLLDIDILREMQEGHGGWNPKMAEVCCCLLSSR